MVQPPARLSHFRAYHTPFLVRVFGWFLKGRSSRRPLRGAGILPAPLSIVLARGIICRGNFRSLHGEVAWPSC